MPRLTPAAELDRLFELIVTTPEGAGIDAIAQQWGAPIHRRTLQRRLALLVAQQRIEMLGDRRTARYCRVSSAAIPAQEPEATWRTAPPPDDMPMSAAQTPTGTFARDMLNRLLTVSRVGSPVAVAIHPPYCWS